MNARAGVLAAVLPALAAAGAADRPNLLFIITDQQFAEVMSCRMGMRLLHTPVMDGLAARGRLFTRAYSSNPLCMPYRNSVFTGLYPHRTGVMENATPPGFAGARFTCMGTYFRNAGYDTGYSGKWHLCFKEGDVASHGFEILRGKGRDGPDDAAADGTLQFLARKHEKPFLLVASFLNPHNICEWARRLAGRTQALNCGEIGDPPDGDLLPRLPSNFGIPSNEPDGMTLIRRAYQVADGPFPVSKFTAEDWRKLRWGYYRMVERVDAQIGRVLDGLRKAGLEETTLVILTSDHGDCAGAHRFNQKTVFYDESSRVPLIVAWKGRTPAGTTDRLVNTGIDILPTLLDAAGIQVPAELPGRSLLALALDREVAGWRDHVVVENHMVQTGVVDGMRPTMEGRMVRTDRYKYCLYSHGQRRESLVDLQSDPGEMNDLAGNPAFREVLLRHRALLATFARDQNDPRAAAMLADDVKPVLFRPEDFPPPAPRSPKSAKRPR